MKIDIGEGVVTLPLSEYSKLSEEAKHGRLTMQVIKNAVYKECATIKNSADYAYMDGVEHSRVRLIMNMLKSIMDNIKVTEV